ncbi:hypothetical protein EJV47_03090 [Hymenobacter gummosus]|uniref:Cytochrome c domain-containing protein n=1 Tax=Hymenobacter gummosus TaxID=1776032 RepID=A0A3S0HCY1_9BACT|nr:hypothetical protein [Hymenobacter gummosus]RTQ53733.1 hypothetical protein EJV47_03090 [Hymenobacter gummosus]
MSLLFLLYSCVHHKITDAGVARVPQRANNASSKEARGFLYLTEGNYHGTGIPHYSLFVRKITKRNTLLAPLPDSLAPTQRSLSTKVPFGYSAVQSIQGSVIINANCFSCHAGHVAGQFVLGLGTTNSIYQKGQHVQALMLDQVVKTMYSRNSRERKAFGHFGDYFKQVSKTTHTPNPFVNPAFRLEETCINHRDPVDLSYKPRENFPMTKQVYASDIPPLWHVRKKRTLYYNGMGNGDKSKLLMQITAMGITDTLMARDVQRHFGDVVAWIESLRPPKYPRTVDQGLAGRGAITFAQKCSGCHGTYGVQESYPNKIVALETLKTDPYYARYFFRNSGLASWYNSSWFATSSPHSSLVPIEGYQAPPLDGVWATAPYLHNGSVPTLKALLNSKLRPLRWEYTNGYNFEEVGLANRPSHAKNLRPNKQTYDASIEGYGNYGHSFSDMLTEQQRSELLEYLKTL